jgi:hypothetical protein
VTALPGRRQRRDRHVWDLYIAPLSSGGLMPGTTACALAIAAMIHIED